MAKKRRKSGNSMKRRSNGRYQMKRAMHKGRVKARAKNQARNREQTPGECILEAIIYLIFSLVLLYWTYHQFISIL